MSEVSEGHVVPWNADFEEVRSRICGYELGDRTRNKGESCSIPMATMWIDYAGLVVLIA